MGKIRKKFCIALLASIVIGIPTCYFFPSLPVAQAAERVKVEELWVEYIGETVVVGEEVSKRDIRVTAYYSDGTTADLKSFTLVSSKIKKEGENTLVVTYNGVRAEFTVEGKAIESIEAQYTGEDVTIGNSVKKKEIIVTVYYSDGSEEEVTDFTISSDIIKRENENELQIVYGGKKTKVTVYGKKPLAIEEIEAYYEGEGVIVGNMPKKEDIHATAYYNDGTTEELTSYTLSPARVSRVGTNKMTLSYKGKSTKIEVEGLPKEVESITATYKGSPLIVGQSVKKEQVEVTATYNDGSKGTTTDFTLEYEVIYEVGANEVNVVCEDKTAMIVVRGIEAEVIDYGNSASTTLRDGTNVTEVEVAVPFAYETKDAKVSLVKKSTVKQAMKRVQNSTDFLAFHIALSDELETELPIAVKVTLPETFDEQGFAVYFTTNGTTVAARINGEFLDMETYQFKIFWPGTYILVNTLSEAGEIPEEDDEEKKEETGKNETEESVLVKAIELLEITGKINLKVGETYTLKTKVLPTNATNKTLKYSSSRKDFVSVSDDGVIQAVKEGVSLITIRATDDSEISQKILVSVEK